MGLNRLFVSQTMLDRWLSESRVEVSGEVMTTQPEQRKFHLKTAVLFAEEVTGAGDGLDLLGRVKDLEQLASFEGEYASGTVIAGDYAYNVVDGFVGELLDETAVVETLESVAMRPPGAAPSRGEELDALGRFFLQSRLT